MIVSKIEGLLNEASKVMATLKPEQSNQTAMKEAAAEELMDFQLESLHALRILFED